MTCKWAVVAILYRLCRLNLKDSTRSSLFIIRYGVGMISSVITIKYFVGRFSNKSLLFFWQCLRILIVTLLFPLSLVSNITVATILLYIVSILDSLNITNDDAVLMPMLWSMSDKKIYTAIYMTVWRLATFFSVFVPLIFNIVELFYAVNLLVLTICLYLSYKNNFI